MFHNLNYRTMLQYILKENVLTDNVLSLPEKGKIFSGRYIAILEEYAFLNSWSDKLNTKKFRCEKRLLKYLRTNYPNFEPDFSGTCLD